MCSSCGILFIDVKKVPSLITCYVTGSRPRIAEAFAAGVDFVQLRAKELDARDLLRLANAAAREKGPGKLFINDRLDVALACGADGLHLPSNRASVSVYRAITPPGFLISVACHSIADIERAEGADYAVLAPIFATPGKGPPLGLAVLRQASRVGIPLLALGGITRENAARCRDAGAAGIAAIRLFEDAPDLPALLKELRD